MYSNTRIKSYTGVEMLFRKIWPMINIQIFRYSSKGTRCVVGLRNDKPAKIRPVEVESHVIRNLSLRCHQPGS